MRYLSPREVYQDGWLKAMAQEGRLSGNCEARAGLGIHFCPVKGPSLWYFVKSMTPCNYLINSTVMLCIVAVDTAY